MSEREPVPGTDGNGKLRSAPGEILLARYSHLHSLGTDERWPDIIRRSDHRCRASV
jgi:hypothetical protein